MVSFPALLRLTFSSPIRWRALTLVSACCASPPKAELKTMTARIVEFSLSRITILEPRFRFNIRPNCLRWCFFFHAERRRQPRRGQLRLLREREGTECLIPSDFLYTPSAGTLRFGPCLS